MEALRKVYKIPKDHKLTIDLPDNIDEDQLVEVIVILKNDKTRKSKIDDIKNGVNDKAYIDDMKEVLNDYQYIDKSDWQYEI
jgi:uncharacterized protein YutD